jgi:hypothetical protein
MGKSAGKAPPPIDPNQVAQAQGAANLEAARQNAAMNRINTTTPFGTTTYTAAGEDAVRNLVNQRYGQYQAGSYQGSYGNDSFGAPIQEAWRGDLEMERARRELGGSADQWTSQTTLSPEAQALVNQLFQDAGSTGGRQQVEDALFARLNPSLELSRTGLETRLRNQGLAPGSEAWGNAMRDVAMQQNDARLAVTAQGGAEQSRAIQALMGLAGAAPQAGGAGGGAQVAPIDWQGLYGQQAAGQNAQYQARAQNAASGNAAAAGIASAALTAAAIA